MQTHDRFPSGIRLIEDLALQTNLEELRRANLVEYESNLINEHDEHPWWSFFDGGVMDEEGACWAVYNRWCDENDAHGWKVVRCSANQAEYREISVKYVSRQDVFRARPGKDGLRAFQLYIHDIESGFTGSDVLSLAIYHNDSTEEVRPTLKYWKHKTAMKPVLGVEERSELETLSAD